MRCTRIGAMPIEGSSSISRRGRAISARPIASICCSPPDIVPAFCFSRSSRRGNSSNTRSRSSAIAEDLERVFELFPRLLEREKQKAGTMSGGEQQMLAIGRALMARPRLLMLDEPSMGIAPILVQRIYETIAQINKDGVTILLVEQNANYALDLASRGYVLETGRVVLANDSDLLRDDPEVQRAYLGT